MREIFDGWKDDPPVFLLLSSFLRGPGEESTTDEMSPSKPSKVSGGITDAQLSKLSVQAGHLLPIRRGKDPLLPKQKPIFDIEELRKLNNMKSEERLQRRIDALKQNG